MILPYSTFLHDPAPHEIYCSFTFIRGICRCDHYHVRQGLASFVFVISLYSYFSHSLDAHITSQYEYNEAQVDV